MVRVTNVGWLSAVLFVVCSTKSPRDLSKLQAEKLMWPIWCKVHVWYVLRMCHPIGILSYPICSWRVRYQHNRPSVVCTPVVSIPPSPSKVEYGLDYTAVSSVRKLKWVLYFSHNMQVHSACITSKHLWTSVLKPPPEHQGTYII